MLKTSWALLAPLLLSFTAGRPDTAHAQAPDMDALIRDPAPGTRNGPALRVGTLVGRTVLGDLRLVTLGGYVAAAARLGPATVEAEHDHLVLHAPAERPDRSGGVAVGEIDRAGLTARIDVAELRRIPGAGTSRLVFWLEAGLGAQRGRWYDGASFRRTDQVAGAGWLLDHRLKRPLGFPSRVGWFFGWRFARSGAPDVETSARVVCKAQRCAPVPRGASLGLLVSSGLAFSW